MTTHGQDAANEANRTGLVMLRHSGWTDVRQLKPEGVDIRDIVGSLGRTSRLNGQTAEPVTTLWHSLLVWAMCADADRNVRIEALLSHAADAYIGPAPWVPEGEDLEPAGTRLRSRLRETCLEAAGVTGGGERSAQVARAEDIAARHEMAAAWGCGEAAPWASRLSPGETDEIGSAAARLGSDLMAGRAADATRERFLGELAAAVPGRAPLRRSLEALLSARRRGEAPEGEGAEGNDWRGPRCLTVVLADTNATYVAAVHENERRPYGRRAVKIDLTDEQRRRLAPRPTGSHQGRTIYEEHLECWLEDEKAGQ